MITLDEILQKNIEFLEITRTFKDSNNNDIIEFNLWIKPTTISLIELYKLKLDYNQTIEMLSNLIKRRIPSNYKLFEFKDTVVLSRLYRDASEIEKQLLSDYKAISHIELKLPTNSVDYILYDLIEKDAQFIDSDGDEHPLNNLVFNRNNLNISCATFKPEEGFKRKSIVGISNEDFKVRTVMPLDYSDCFLNSHYCEDSKKYETDICMDYLSLVPHELYIDGKEINPLYMMSVLSSEFYMHRFARVFDLQVMKNSIDALAYKTFDYPIKYVNQQRKSYSYSNRSIKNVTIAPAYKIPEIIELSKHLASNRFEDIVSWLRFIRLEYGTDVYNLVKNVCATIDFSDRQNLPLVIKLQQSTIHDLYAKEGLIAHALKTSCSMNKIFMEIFKNNKDIQTSCIYNSMLKITTYPVELGGLI